MKKLSNPEVEGQQEIQNFEKIEGIRPRAIINKNLEEAYFRSRLRGIQFEEFLLRLVFPYSD